MALILKFASSLVVATHVVLIRCVSINQIAALSDHVSFLMDGSFAPAGSTPRPSSSIEATAPSLLRARTAWRNIVSSPAALRSYAADSIVKAWTEAARTEKELTA
jgi:hypothetical protein